MKLTHQVFMQLPHGGRLWVASATSLQDASEYSRALAAKTPGTYVIVDLRSQGVVKPIEKGNHTVWPQRLSARIRLLQGVAKSFATSVAF
jgi:hypothetical protein